MTGLYRTINRISESESSNPWTGANEPTEGEIASRQPPEIRLAAPPEMPVAGDMEKNLMRKRGIALQRRRSGRASTILTDTSETLG